MPSLPYVETIVLAAGRARRMGSNKLVANLGGRAVVAHVVDTIAAAGLPPPIVVLGHGADAVRAALGGRAARFVVAPDHALGMAHSLRAGVAAIADEAAAALVCLGDMPFVAPALLGRMRRQANEDDVFAPCHAGRRGNPVMWGRNWFTALLALEGDGGARPLLDTAGNRLRLIDAGDDGVHIDIDHPDALFAARSRF